ncbi:MAG: hypothetical protein J6T16_06725 [Opitutales bacterium]|nr:hypothetical protein [Opitutales bacterium]
MPNQEEDKASMGLCVLSFIIPLAGIILWAIKKNEIPNAAKTYLKVSLAAIAIGVALNILLSILF